MIRQVLIAFDQLGNALAGGFADQTISGRVGYMSIHSPHTWRWNVLRSVIDWGLYPVDGINHCVNSIEEDRNVSPHTSYGFVSVSVLALFFAPLIGIVLRISLPIISKFH